MKLLHLYFSPLSFKPSRLTYGQPESGPSLEAPESTSEEAVEKIEADLSEANANFGQLKEDYLQLHEEDKDSDETKETYLNLLNSKVEVKQKKAQLAYVKGGRDENNEAYVKAKGELEKAAEERKAAYEKFAVETTTEALGDLKGEAESDKVEEGKTGASESVGETEGETVAEGESQTPTDPAEASQGETAAEGEVDVPAEGENVDVETSEEEEIIDVGNILNELSPTPNEFSDQEAEIIVRLIKEITGGEELNGDGLNRIWTYKIKTEQAENVTLSPRSLVEELTGKRVEDRELIFMEHGVEFSSTEMDAIDLMVQDQLKREPSVDEYIQLWNEKQKNPEVDFKSIVQDHINSILLKRAPETLAPVTKKVIETAKPYVEPVAKEAAQAVEVAASKAKAAVEAFGVDTNELGDKAKEWFTRKMAEQAVEVKEMPAENQGEAPADEGVEADAAEGSTESDNEATPTEDAQSPEQEAQPEAEPSEGANEGETDMVEEDQAESDSEAPAEEETDGNEEDSEKKRKQSRFNKKSSRIGYSPYSH